MPIQDKKKNLITMEISFNPSKFSKSYQYIIINSIQGMGLVGKILLSRGWKTIVRLSEGERGAWAKSTPSQKPWLLQKGPLKSDTCGVEKHLLMRKEGHDHLKSAIEVTPIVIAYTLSQRFQPCGFLWKSNLKISIIIAMVSTLLICIERSLNPMLSYHLWGPCQG